MSDSNSTFEEILNQENLSLNIDIDPDAILREMSSEEVYEAEEEIELRESQSAVHELRRKIVSEVLGILKASECKEKWCLKVVMVILLGVFSIFVAYRMFDILEIILKNEREDGAYFEFTLSLLAIVWPSFKLIIFSLNKMVDYVFTVDKTLIKLLLDIWAEKGVTSEKAETSKELMKNAILKLLIEKLFNKKN